MYAIYNISFSRIDKFCIVKYNYMSDPKKAWIENPQFSPNHIETGQNNPLMSASKIV